MKRYLSLLIAAVMVLGLLAGCGGTDTQPQGGEAGEYRVAMITDYCDITDQSFNQTSYEGCAAYCEPNGVQIGRASCRERVFGDV